MSHHLCTSCGTTISEVASQDPDGNPMCNECAAKLPARDVIADDGATLRSSLGLQARDRPGKKPFLVKKVGDSLHNKTGKWMHREMTINRRENTYEETVLDPATGEIVHKVAEPLDQHQGHGDATPSAAPTDEA